MTESRVNALKKQCEEHSTTMAKKADELLTYKAENFMKAYPLGTGARVCQRGIQKDHDSHEESPEKCELRVG